MTTESKTTTLSKTVAAVLEAIGDLEDQYVIPLNPEGGQPLWEAREREEKTKARLAVALAPLVEENERLRGEVARWRDLLASLHAEATGFETSGDAAPVCLGCRYDHNHKTGQCFASCICHEVGVALSATQVPTPPTTGSSEPWPAAGALSAIVEVVLDWMETDLAEEAIHPQLRAILNRLPPSPAVRAAHDEDTKAYREERIRHLEEKFGTAPPTAEENERIGPPACKTCGARKTWDFIDGIGETWLCWPCDGPIAPPFPVWRCPCCGGTMRVSHMDGVGFGYTCIDKGGKGCRYWVKSGEIITPPAPAPEIAPVDAGERGGRE